MSINTVNYYIDPKKIGFEIGKSISGFVGAKYAVWRSHATYVAYNYHLGMAVDYMLSEYTKQKIQYLAGIARDEVQAVSVRFIELAGFSNRTLWWCNNVISPTAEELVFRSCLQGGMYVILATVLDENCAHLLSTVSSSIVFAAAHESFQYPNFAETMLTGVAFGSVYAWGNTADAIGSHIAYNISQGGL